jgi:hypothetical protein
LSISTTLRANCSKTSCSGLLCAPQAGSPV